MKAKPQAVRCTRKELAFLRYWRGRGFKIGVNERIPLSTITPPSLATRRPVLDALIGIGTVLLVMAMVGYWIASAAKII